MAGALGLGEAQLQLFSPHKEPLPHTFQPWSLLRNVCIWLPGEPRPSPGGTT